MPSEFKKFSPYLLLLFIFSAILGLFLRGNQLATSIWLGVAVVTCICLIGIEFGSLLLVKKDKNLWYTETLIADNNAIFVFGEDERHEAKEIVENVRRLYNAGVLYPVLNIFGVETRANFWGKDFYCPFSTTVSTYLCITPDGVFCRSNSGLEVLEKFDAISFGFLQELHRELALQVEKLPDLSEDEW